MKTNAYVKLANKVNLVCSQVCKKEIRPVRYNLNITVRDGYGCQHPTIVCRVLCIYGGFSNLLKWHLNMLQVW